jgi:hypothetical protein
MTSDTLDALIQRAPIHRNSVTPDNAGVLEAMRLAGVAPSSVLTVSHCKFGTANIEALVDDDTLAFVHTAGVLCTAGKRRMIGRSVKYETIDFAMCRGFAPADYTDERGFGKFGIEFGGPGGVLLGRLHWSWRAKRFKDSRAEIMAVASERDRVLGLIVDLIG